MGIVLYLGHLHFPGEIANNDCAKFCGVKEVYCGISASKELFKQLSTEKFDLCKEVLSERNYTLDRLKSGGVGVGVLYPE